MKFLFSILLMTIYLAGTFQSSWTLIDFYLNRDHYTQAHCKFIDEDITQCRASCYLEKLLKEEKSQEPSSTIVPSQKTKSVEISSNEIIENLADNFDIVRYSDLSPEPHAYDYHAAIFRPPIC